MTDRFRKLCHWYCKVFGNWKELGMISDMKIEVIDVSRVATYSHFKQAKFDFFFWVAKSRFWMSTKTILCDIYLSRSSSGIPMSGSSLRKMSFSSNLYWSLMSGNTSSYRISSQSNSTKTLYPCYRCMCPWRYSHISALNSWWKLAG